MLAAAGLCVLFRSLPWLTEASQARVYMTDPACTSPTFHNNLQLLKAALSRPNNFTTLSIWQDWFSRSFAISVYNTYHDIKAALGDNMPTTLSQHQRTRGCPSLNPDDGARRKKTLPVQKIIYQLISNHRSPHRTERIRHKLRRWLTHSHTTPNIPPRTPILHLTPNWQSSRAAHLLTQLQNTTTPRVRTIRVLVYSQCFVRKFV